MSKTTYPGLDYSLGKSNFDTETGIHFGVISQNSINLDCTEDFEYDYGKPTCPECGNEIKPSDEVEPDADWNNGKDYACADCQKCYWSESVYSEESLGWTYERDGYQLTDCLDNEIFVLKSPFYTFAQFCSPCVPGAGNLDSPREDGPKTYCLGHDWFEDGKAPYPVYRVSDGTEVTGKDESK